MSIHGRYLVTLGQFTLDVEFRAPASGVTAIVGPSGCGKTTLLRCIAALVKPQAGYFQIGDITWQDDKIFMPCHRRSIGYVFQQANLFPHLNVRRNIEFGMKRIPPGERTVNRDQIIEMLGISHLLDANPSTLSGGESRRVAIARALLTSPRLLLMDEPLTALDDASRHEILSYLQPLFRQLDIPVFYVSHTRDEIETIASNHIVMAQGKLVLQGDAAKARDNSY